MKYTVSRVYYNGRECWRFESSPLCFRVRWQTDYSITMEEYFEQQLALVNEYTGERRPAW